MSETIDLTESQPHSSPESASEVQIMESIAGPAPSGSNQNPRVVTLDEVSGTSELSELEKFERIKQFVSSTFTDDDLGAYYVKKADWCVQKAIDQYFEDLRTDAVKKRSEREKEESKIVKKPKLEESPAPKQEKAIGDDASKLHFVTWNIDGLNERNFEHRVKGVAIIIKSLKPDIIHLQEVVPRAEEIFRRELPDYEIISCHENCPPMMDYYVCTLVKKETGSISTYTVIPYEDSSMGRNLLEVELKIRDVELTSLNTHLESTKDFAETRKEQLRQALNLMDLTPTSRSIIFAGDLNLRDKEITELGGIPSHIKDMWIATGSRKEVEFTWDAMRNTNIEFAGFPAENSGKSFWRPRLRFDRVYYKKSEPPKLKPCYFGLIGLEKLKPRICYPSDHWGIYCQWTYV